MFWSTIVVFAAAAAAAISAEHAVTFPEVAREYSASRIVSGWEAQPGQIPYQMSLRMVSATGGVTSCGATLIHEEWGLTAAHCTASRVSFVLRLGAVNLTTPNYIIETTNYYNYPDYNNNLPAIVQPHDIGLLELGRKIIFNALVQPIRLQRSEDRDRDVGDQRLVASGWGRTWTNGASSENLNWVYLSGVSNQQCSNAFGGSSIIVASTICARGYNDTTQSTCQGDSGGPLVGFDDDGNLSQFGVTSFVSGAGCHAGFPAGFIRPGHYHEWFTNVTGINFDWVLEENETTTELPPTNPTTTETPEQPSTSTTELPEVTTELPDGTTELPDGTTGLPEGTTELPEGTTELPEGTTGLPEGTTELPEGTTELPDGTTELPNGTTESPEVEEEDCEEGLEYFGGPVNFVGY